ncbi:hypothetical protein OE88DRAFT_654084 [Heliocybe sulcata]|uniref:Uncharacterized protein n=1 Tax=Heliocybe sulcata TaxID=5364 RepID=A0A5C3NED6_9AGAM|nr:hypothetical protein OE88DRAFT_654084 [Heliocybe sulcata]
MFDDQLLDDAPPPAYEASERELDRKISMAVQQSLTISQSPRGADDGEEVWEEWDEAAFEAAARNAAAAGSSSSPTESSVANSSESSGVSPLRIVKKRKPASESSAAEEKRRLALSVRNQEHEQEISVPSYQERSPRPLPGHHIPEEDEDSQPVPPPPVRVRSHDVGWNDNDSRISSPLSSPTLAPSNQLQYSQERPMSASTASSMTSSPPPQNSPTFQPLAAPRRPVNRTSPRPSTSYTPSSKNSTSGAVRVNFDPKVAYKKSSTFGKLPMDEEPGSGSVNAASLYKSVSSVLRFECV